jgi:hypothetical protein
MRRTAAGTVTAFARRRNQSIGNIDFDRVRDDAKGDVLYLRRADPAAPWISMQAQKATRFAPIRMGV